MSSAHTHSLLLLDLMQQALHVVEELMEMLPSTGRNKSCQCNGFWVWGPESRPEGPNPKPQGLPGQVVGELRRLGFRVFHVASSPKYWVKGQDCLNEPCTPKTLNPEPQTTNPLNRLGFGV